jgi:creatinine amidohydrolase
VSRILARDPRLIFPVGALEQHGPHLPLGTNTFIADRVADELSSELGILRAPTLPYGVGLPAQQPFAGTATMRRKTFHRAVNELLAGWEDHGFREFIILTAHRYEPHLDALLMALTTEAVTTVIDLYAIDVADILDAHPEAEHGGEVETSLLLHLAPERVRPEQIADYLPDPGTLRRYVRGRVPTPPPGSAGTVGRPSRASAEIGRRLYERYLEGVRKAVSEGQPA